MCVAVSFPSLTHTHTHTRAHVISSETDAIVSTLVIQISSENPDKDVWEIFINIFFIYLRHILIYLEISMLALSCLERFLVAFILIVYLPFSPPPLHL